MNESQPQFFEFGDFRLDVSKRLLTKGDCGQIPLTPKVFDTLLYLVRHGGKVLEKDELMREIWADTIVEENNLSQNISILRRVLGEKRGEHRFIATIPGRGFKFVAEVKPILDFGFGISEFEDEKNFVENQESKTENQITSGDGQQSTEPIQSQKRFVAFAVLSIITLGFLGFYLWRANRKNASPTKTVAVLPFVNASRNGDAEYLSDGITESVINNLSQLAGLKVMSKNSAFRFKNNQTDTKNIAAQLGVENLVTGDIKQIGDKLVIDVRLIDADDGSQIWGSQYVKTSGDVIAAQNEIALDVSRKLGARLSGADEQKLAKKYTENPEAYQLFLKGRYYFDKRTPQDSKKALDYFQQAIVADPNFALAYAYLSSFHGYGYEASKAKEAALKAVSLDDRLSTAHDALGSIFYKHDYDFVGAEREFKRALELDPNDASARESYGVMLTGLGRHEEALAEMRLAAETNPISPVFNSSYGDSLLYAGRYDEAIAQFKKSLELDVYFVPAHYGLSIAYQMQRNYAESVEEVAKINEIVVGAQGAAFVRKSFANGGWQGFLRAVTGNGQAPKPPPYVLATLYAELGDKDNAFAILNKLYEDHAYLGMLKVDPRFDSLRDDARFTEILKKINLE